MSVSVHVDGFECPNRVRDAQLTFATIEEKHNYDQGDEIMAAWSALEIVVSKHMAQYAWTLNMGWASMYTLCDILGIERPLGACGTLDPSKVPDSIHDEGVTSRMLRAAYEGPKQITHDEAYVMWKRRSEDFIKLAKVAKLTGRDFIYG